MKRPSDLNRPNRGRCALAELCLLFILPMAAGIFVGSHFFIIAAIDRILSQ